MVLITDFGYDISDYEAIQPEYGTMDDFNELIAKAKELGKNVCRERENMTQKMCFQCIKFMFILCMFEDGSVRWSCHKNSVSKFQIFLAEFQTQYDVDTFDVNSSLLNAL